MDGSSQQADVWFFLLCGLSTTDSDQNKIVFVIERMGGVVQADLDLRVTSHDRACSPRDEKQTCEN